MSVAEPTIVRIAALATKFAMMAKCAIDVATHVPRRTSDGTCLVLQDEHLAGTETLAVMVVAILVGSAGAGKVIAVAALARLLSAGQEALFRTRVCTWEGSIESFVVDIKDDVAALCYFLRRNVDILRARTLADGCP